MFKNLKKIKKDKRNNNKKHKIYMIKLPYIYPYEDRHTLSLAKPRSGSGCLQFYIRICIRIHKF